MLNGMLKSFVTEPDFDKGFQYSQKVLNHHELEDKNEHLRRQLATALISIKNSRRCNKGGLLDVQFVIECVLQNINNLGEEIDALSETCREAKRGDAVLSERTELMQHRFSKLSNWLEWLKMPSVPMASDSGCGNPNCPCVCISSVPQPFNYSNAIHSNASTVRLAQAYASVDPHKAADEAMQQLLLEGMSALDEDSRHCGFCVSGSVQSSVAC